MAEEKKGEKEVDQRFKYIGFEVFPSKVKKFWRNPDEEKRYLEKVKERRKKGEREERDHSLVFVPAFSVVEKWVLTITSALMILSLLLPWFRFTRGEDVLHYNALNYLFNLGAIMTYSGLGGILIGVIVVIFLFIILSAFFIGIYNLISLYGKINSIQEHLLKVKKSLRLNLIPFLLWVVALILSIIGAGTPLAGAFGVNELKDSFNVLTLVSISGYGLWISLGCWMINSIKASDL